MTPGGLGTARCSGDWGAGDRITVSVLPKSGGAVRVAEHRPIRHHGHPHLRFQPVARTKLIMTGYRLRIRSMRPAIETIAVDTRRTVSRRREFVMSSCADAARGRGSEAAVSTASPSRSGRWKRRSGAPTATSLRGAWGFARRDGNLLRSLMHVVGSRSPSPPMTRPAG